MLLVYICVCVCCMCVIYVVSVVCSIIYINCVVDYHSDAFLFVAGFV